MSDWGRFNSQFRETERERNERLRKSYARRLAREKDTDTVHTATIATRPAEPRPHADPYAIDATKCAKCGSGECHVQVLAWATFEGGSFVAFEYDEEVIPMRTIAICADCGTERVIEP